MATADLLLDLMEATRRHARARLLAPTQRKLESAMRKAFRAQGKVVSAGFARQFKRDWPTATQESRRLAEVGIIDRIGALFSAAFAATRKLFVGPLTAAAKSGLATGGQALIAELGVDISFSLDHPDAVAYLEAHGAELVAGIDDTTRATIQAIVTQAVDEGWSYDRTAREITDRFSEFAVGKPQEHIDSRAHLVATQEVGEAYMTGQYIVGKGLTDKGLAMEKSWSTMGDPKVSDLCQGNEDAGWIPFDDAFPSGHQHPLGHVACRCDMLTRLAPD